MVVNKMTEIIENQNHVEKFTLPEGVSIKVHEGIITVSGPKGEVSKSFLHPLVQIKIHGNVVEFETERYMKQQKKLLNTFLSHLKNICTGVLKGHEYKLKICSGHFPMNVSLKGNTLEVKNFIGEAVPRRVQIKEGTTAKLEGDIITVSGINKDLTSQMAATIEKMTRRNGFDKRIFQDGIYIIQKDGKKLE